MDTLKIATEYLNFSNPSLWNGEGTMPLDFVRDIVNYNVCETCLLDISFGKLGGRWTIICELRSKGSKNPYRTTYCGIINNPKVLSNTLKGLIRNYATSNRAAAIAEEHLHRMNPSLWNGEGNPPEDFDSRISSYNVGELEVLDVSFENIDGKWTHYCELRDRESEDLLEDAHGDGVNSIQNLADTIAGICDWMV